MKINELTIKQAQEKLEKGEIFSVELTQACLDRINEIDDKVKSCLTLCEKEALARAEEADLRRKKGEKGELLGIPFLAKDNIMTKGIRTTAGSKILENYTAPYDATIIKRLKDAGAILLGKTNLDEFGHGGSGENSAFHPTHNPWDLERVPGGSSSGSSAAVASDMCIFSLGTDTGGSIRCPASFCNVVGLKPSYGRNSRFGLMSMTSSTDVPGPITKTVEDAAVVLKIIAGKDEHDPTTGDIEVENYLNNINEDITGVKIGIPEDFLKEANEDIIKIIDEAKKKFKKGGVEIVPIKLPHAKYGIPVYYIITPSEISSNLARYDGIRYGYSEKNVNNLLEIYTKSRNKGFGPEVKRRIMLGTYTLSAGYYDAYYLRAQKVRTKIIEDFDKAFKKVDLIMTPTQPDVAYKIGEQSNDPLKMYLEDIFLSPASLAGLPAISIPAGFVKNLPVGLQLIGKKFDEKMIFRAGNYFQKITDFHTKKLSI